MILNKSLILENIKLINEPFYIYHVGIKGYKEILPGGLVRTKKEELDYMKKYNLSKEYMKKYNYEISAFLSPVTKEHIQLLRTSGFEAWSGRELYLYKVNINSPKNRKKISYINYTSTPEQTKAYEQYFKPVLKKYKNASEEIWNKKIEPYRKASKNFKYTNKNLSLDQAINIDNNIMNDMKDLDKWFKYNSIHGSKQQYASFIPHIQLGGVKSGLKFESVNKII